MILLDWIKGVFSGLLASLRKFFELALPLAKQIVLAQLKDIALEAVKKLDVTTLSNEEKRKQAFKEIAEYAKTHGIQAKDSLINLAIEIALQVFRKD